MVDNLHVAVVKKASWAFVNLTERRDHHSINGAYNGVEEAGLRVKFSQQLGEKSIFLGTVHC